MRWVVMVVVLVACAPPHQTFPSTPPDVTPEQRVEAFNRYVAAKEHWISQNGAVIQHSVIMQDGTEVYYPEDLVPLVGDESSTAKHARQAVRARGKQKMWSYITLGAIVTGAVLVFKTFDDRSTLTNVGFGLVLGGLVTYGISTYYRFKVNGETHDAYEAYDDDLATKLSVCIAALQVVPCEAVPQQGAPPATSNGGYYGTKPTNQ